MAAAIILGVLYLVIAAGVALVSWNLLNPYGHQNHTPVARVLLSIMYGLGWFPLLMWLLLVILWFKITGKD